MARLRKRRPRLQRAKRERVPKNLAAAKWEREQLKAHGNVCFYDEVRGDDLVTIAYDGKTGARYGEFTLEEKS